MDTLKEGIGLRGYGQKDPLIEYKFEAFNYFKVMLDSIKKEVMIFILKMEFVSQPEEPVRRPRQAVNIQHQDFNIFQNAQAQREARQAEMARSGVPGRGDEAPKQPRQQAISGQKIGRNDPCPCGSGKKYKHCHGRNA
jgi:preprotein translocase subunit SecA